MINSLIEMGFSMPGFNGPMPLPFSEIDAWARTSKNDLPGHEALTLKNLSREYCNEYYLSKHPNRPKPMIIDGPAPIEQTDNAFKSLVDRYKESSK